MKNLPNDVPNFPKWRDFVSEDLEWYEAFYIDYLLPYAEPSPINIRTWAMAYGDLQITKIGKLLMMKFRNILGEGRPTFFILGQKIDSDALQKIFDFQLDLNLISEISYVPVALLGDISQERYNIELQRDEAEYLFSTQEHIDLEGPAFYKIRQQVSCFKRFHSKDALDVRHISCPKEYKYILNYILKNWKMTANDSHINLEGEILKKIALLADFSKIKMLTLSINSQLASVVIYSIYNKIAIIQHIKVDYDFDKIFGYTSHILAQELHKLGVEFMNYEQDLGLDGLRQYKNRLRPVKLLEKARITPTHPAS